MASVHMESLASPIDNPVPLAHYHVPDGPNLYSARISSEAQESGVSSNVRAMSKRLFVGLQDWYLLHTSADVDAITPPSVQWRLLCAQGQART